MKLLNCLALLQFPIVQLIYLRLVKIDTQTNVQIHHIYTYGSLHYIVYENTFLGCIRGCYKLWNMFKIVRFDRYMNLKVDLPFMVYSPISFELCKVGQKTFCWKGFDHSERKGPKLKHEWITLIRWNELCAHAIKCDFHPPLYGTLKNISKSDGYWSG